MRTNTLGCLFATMALVASTGASAQFTSASAPPPPPPPPGSSQGNPVLPGQWTTASGSTPGSFRFFNPVTGLWYDPPLVDGFTISLDSGSFLSVTAPTGFAALKIRVGTTVVNTNFNAGDVYAFGASTAQFDIFGISPLLDVDLPSFISAFPLLLSFSGNPSTMTWTAFTSPVPETSTYALVLMGLVGIGVLLGRRQRTES